MCDYFWSRRLAGMMAPWSLRWYAFLSFYSLSEMLELTLILNP
jgi:hypothetical protein